MIRMLAIATSLCAALAAHAGPTYERAEAALSKEPPDYDTAIPLLVDAIGQGDARAMYRLGFLFQHGKGVKLTLERAVSMYRMAAAKGHVDAIEALDALGEADMASRDRVATPKGVAASRDAESQRKAQLAALDSNAASVYGSVVSVVDGGLLLDIARRGGAGVDDSTTGSGTNRTDGAIAPEIIYLRAKSVSGVPGGATVSAKAVESRPFKYTTVAGSQSTVKGYRAIGEIKIVE
jgi:hypothetical protein